MIGTFFSDDDICPRSPGLERVFPRAAPSPSPPPVVTQGFHPPVSSPSSRRRSKANRRKTRPTQGDWVLIRQMDPNQPDIAQQASQRALNSESGSDDEDDMDDQSPGSATAPLGPIVVPLARSGTQPFSLQQTAKDALGTTDQPTATSTHRDSVLEADIHKGTFIADRRPSEVCPVTILPNGARRDTNDANFTTPIISSSIPFSTSPNQTNQRNGSVASPWSHEEISTNLRHLQIPQSRDKLPALQPQSLPSDAASPNSHQLPSILHMVGDIPRSASISEDPTRPNGFHRPSVSSLGHSPTSIVRQLSISSHSPATPFPPLSASSPSSAIGDLQKGDMFLRSGSGNVFSADNRRPSQASENGRYASTLHSGSTSEGYQSSDGPSPGAQHTPVDNWPRQLSLDGTIASTIILPPPIGSGIQAVPSQAGSFRCDAPGCNAVPFQTQYLLK
jgi:hypothetical protein